MAMKPKKNHTRTYLADQAFAKTTGIGKTAQASRGMNIYAKENIPKGQTVLRVRLKSGKSVPVIGLTKSESARRTMTSQPSGYKNPASVKVKMSNKLKKKPSPTRRKRGM